jgi:hypothetical protein
MFTPIIGMRRKAEVFVGSRLQRFTRRSLPEVRDTKPKIQ